MEVRRLVVRLFNPQHKPSSGGCIMAAMLVLAVSEHETAEHGIKHPLEQERRKYKKPVSSSCVAAGIRGCQLAAETIEHIEGRVVFDRSNWFTRKGRDRE